ncbi:hypothetical protein J7J26_02460 [Candidatus Micrarchaeota archaeon]|nr:hypothetical protein [Candidatus Micrarchaeota archaeon]
MKIIGLINNKEIMNPRDIKDYRLREDFIRVKNRIEDMSIKSLKLVNKLTGRRPDIKKIIIALNDVFTQDDTRLMHVEDKDIYINWIIMSKNINIHLPFSKVFIYNILRRTKLGIEYEIKRRELLKNDEYGQNFDNIIINLKNEDIANDIMISLLFKHKDDITIFTDKGLILHVKPASVESFACLSLTSLALSNIPYIPQPDEMYIINMNKARRWVINRKNEYDMPGFEEYDNVLSPLLLYATFGPFTEDIQMQRVQDYLLTLSSSFMYQMFGLFVGDTKEMFNTISENPPETYTNITYPSTYFDYITHRKDEKEAVKV